MLQIGITSEPNQIEEALRWGRQWQTRLEPGRFKETQDDVDQREAYYANMEKADVDENDDESESNGREERKGKGKAKASTVQA